MWAHRVLDIQRMLSIPGGTVFWNTLTLGPAAEALSSTTGLLFGVNPFGSTVTFVPGSMRVRLDSEIFVVCAPEQNLAIRPNLDQSFQFGFTVAGAISVQSNTTNMVANALAGNVCTTQKRNFSLPSTTSSSYPSTHCFFSYK